MKRLLIIPEDFISDYKLPKINSDDKDWPYHLTQVLRMIDTVGFMENFIIGENKLCL